MKLHGVRFSIHRTFFSLPPLISSLSLPRVFYRLSHTCTNHLTFSHRSTKRDRIVFFRRIKQVGENSFEMVFPFSLFFFFFVRWKRWRNHGDLAQRMSIQMKRCTYSLLSKCSQFSDPVQTVVQKTAKIAISRWESYDTPYSKRWKGKGERRINKKREEG